MIEYSTRFLLRYLGFILCIVGCAFSFTLQHQANHNLAPLVAAAVLSIAVGWPVAIDMYGRMPAGFVFIWFGVAVVTAIGGSLEVATIFFLALAGFAQFYLVFVVLITSHGEYSVPGIVVLMLIQIVALWLIFTQTVPSFMVAGTGGLVTIALYLIPEHWVVVKSEIDDVIVNTQKEDVHAGQKLAARLSGEVLQLMQKWNYNVPRNDESSGLSLGNSRHERRATLAIGVLQTFFGGVLGNLDSCRITEQGFCQLPPNVRAGGAEYASYLLMKGCLLSEGAANVLWKDIVRIAGEGALLIPGYTVTPLPDQRGAEISRIVRWRTGHE